MTNTVFTKEVMRDYINELYELIYESQKLNYIRWDVLNSKQFMEAVIRGSFEAEVDYLKEYVEKKGYEIMPVSAATGEGLQDLMWKAWEMARQYVAEPEEEIGVIDEGDPDSFEIIRGAEDADFEVKGKNIERLVAMTNFDNEEALYRFQLIWKRLKIEEALLEAGIQEGQTVRILDMVFNYQKSKWADKK